MANKAWKTFHLVVEVPVRGAVTSKNIVSWIEAAIDHGIATSTYDKPRELKDWGRIKVKYEPRVKAGLRSVK